MVKVVGQLKTKLEKAGSHLELRAGPAYASVVAERAFIGIRNDIERPPSRR